MDHTVDTLAAMVRDVAKVLNTKSATNEILQRCTELLVAHLDAAFARIWTLNADESTLQLIASAGMYTHLDGSHARVEVGKLKIGLIASEKQPHFTNDVQHDPRVGNHQWARQNGIIAFAGYPMLVGDELIGVIGLFSKRELSAQTLACLESVSDSIGGFIQRRSEEQQRKLTEVMFHDFADRCRDMFWIFDIEQKTYKYISPACSAIFGVSQEAMLGDPLAFMTNVVEEDVAALTQFVDDVRRDPGYAEIEYRVRTRTGGTKFIWSRLFPLTDSAGRIDRLAGISHDVTERKEAELRVNQFYSTVSHELRTPIASIQGALTLIHHNRVNEQEASELVSIALDNCKRLTRLVNDILDLRKIEAGKLPLKISSINVEKSISSTLTLLNSLALGKEITLESSVDPKLTVAADPDRLTQVVTNLVANAIKFSPPGSRVQVVAQPQNERIVRVEVRDNGSGIDESDLPKLFNVFQQLDADDDRQNAGSGLGLAISKALIERQGGNIGVQSKLGAGSTFWFELPSALPVY